MPDGGHRPEGLGIELQMAFPCPGDLAVAWVHNKAFVYNTLKCR